MRVDVVMPKMGESVQEGKIIRWVKRVGERVEQDETLLEISTDKVDTEIPAPASGVLAEILAPEGETVPVGTVIARTAGDLHRQGGHGDSGAGIGSVGGDSGTRRRDRARGDRHRPNRRHRRSHQHGSANRAGSAIVEGSRAICDSTTVSCNTATIARCGACACDCGAGGIGTTDACSAGAFGQWA